MSAWDQIRLQDGPGVSVCLDGVCVGPDIWMGPEMTESVSECLCGRTTGRNYVGTNCPFPTGLLVGVEGLQFVPFSANVNGAGDAAKATRI